MEEKSLILIKYGGNAMLNEHLQRSVVQTIVKLKKQGFPIVLVHGGGPFIRKMLDLASVHSEFIGGHRKTSPKALRYIEMALKGEVNGNMVRLFNKAGVKAVGLSGKDGKMVTARKRYHIDRENGKEIKRDLGQVGEVERIDTRLLRLLLKDGFLPVITCIACDEEGNDYNVNADLFAGSLAGALQAEHYLILTDVDGLMRDVEDPDSVIPKLKVDQLSALRGTVIKGGMIPKLDSCRIALNEGAHSARIINGTKPESILQAIQSTTTSGTEICL